MAQAPSEFSVVLTEDERAELVRLLETALGDVRMEVHHTRTPAFRDQVLHEKEVIRGLLEKLRQLPPSS